MRSRLPLVVALLLACAPLQAAAPKRLLYVVAPGIRDYLEFGGAGILVFDIDKGHAFVKRVETHGTDKNGKPLNVKGICANAVTGRLYVSTIKTLICLDLASDKLLWEKSYDGGCDRMSISPDGKTIYLPTLEGDDWHVVDALSGAVLATLSPKSGAHNTVYGPDGREAYLAGLKSTWLTVAETSRHTLGKKVGPFSAPIRPFTVNGSQTLCFVNVNVLLGFEVGDLITGKKLYRVEVEGFKQGPTKRHGCPSHGIAMTPDESEIWLTDAANKRLHIFDATVMPPKQKESVLLRDEPGWITMSIDGSLAWPSTGDVVEVKSRKIVGALKDEEGRDVQSEKLLEIDFIANHPFQAGDQFGIGRKAK